MRRVTHFLSGLEVGGKERIAVDLAARGRSEGLDHRLLLFDEPFRGEAVDFDPGDTPVSFIRRGAGVDWRFARKVARYVEATGTEILHTHNDSAFFYGALVNRFVTRRLRPGVVGTFHTRPSHVTWRAKLSTRWASRRNHAVFAVSDELRDVLLADRWLDRCETLWNGVDVETFRPGPPETAWRASLGLSPETIAIAHVGRFDPIKRHVDLLAAARLIGERDATVAFILVGQGPILGRIREEASDLENVRFAPRVTDMPGFMRAIDVFTLCSDHEATPCAMLEAMASAKPIVGTAVGGIPAIVTPPGAAACGRLIEPRNPRALADALLALIGDPATRRRQGEAARARVVAHFSADRVWADYRAAYEAARPAGRAPAAQR